MKYLKVFETTTEHQSYLNGNIITPSITITRNNESTINYVSEVIEGELSFPLYLNIPFIQDTPDFGNTKEYVLQNSEIITKLWDFLCQHILLDRVDNEPLGTWYVPDNFCTNYPIYVNNIKITDIVGDFMWNDDPTKPSMLLFRGDNIYECSIDENGIWCYIYKLITFTFEGKEYQAKEGMTWWQFINTTYNDGTFTAVRDTAPVHLISSGVEVGYNTNRMITADEVIEDKHNYIRYYHDTGGSIN